MYMKKLKLFISVLIIFITPVVFAEEIEEIPEEQITTNPNQVELEKCIDGNSAKFKHQDGKVITYRFLAIDAPDLDHPQGAEPYAQEASTYTCEQLTKASVITLEFDENATEEDVYNRGLAWVFVDGELLQEKLVTFGYAKTGYLYGNYKYNELLLEKEQIAASQKIGIWEDKSKEETTEKPEEIKQEEKHGFWAFLDKIAEAITASINRFVDSILQMIEGML